MDQLESYLDSLYGDMSGFVCVATKVPNTPVAPEKKFYEWPAEKTAMATFIRETSVARDVWVNPCLWLTEQIDPKTFRYSRWIWAEFNSKPDERMDFFPPMGIKVESSTGRLHAMWRLPDFQNDPEKLERFNKRLAFNFLSNFASYRIDALLRPPETINHRTGEKVKIGRLSDSVATYESLMSLEDPKPDDFVSFTVSDKTVPVWKLLSKLGDEKTASLIFETEKVEDKWGHLVNVACGCLKRELEYSDVVVAIKSTDKFLKVFTNRDDADRQILGIIGMARKVAEIRSQHQSLFSNIFNIVELSEMETKIEWVMPGLLTSTGTAMIFARPNVGKTRLALQMARSIALGKQFVGFNVKRTGRVLFISNEMNPEELREFVIPGLAQHDADEREHLRRNVFAYASNSGLSLEDPNGFDNLQRILDKVEPMGIFFDSLIATAGDPTQLGFMNDLFGRMRTIQAERDAFAAWIHHPRKENGRDHKPKTMDDVYGCRAVTSAPSVIIGMWQDQPNSNEPVELHCIKNRFAPYFGDRMLESNRYLGFDPAPHLMTEKKPSIEETIRLVNTLGEVPEQATSTETKVKKSGGGYQF